ncbi:MAG TPA: nuclear transport factor 2 family protein [Candidatus Sulfotelmatobacter sp.]|nr:nuclear transport factor 2 family protein [Candidatus Sulfotelmatobacter sp.]
MNRLAIVLFCSLPLTFATSQTKADPGAVIIALENAWTQAEAHNDAAALGKLLDDSVVITQPDGSIQTKAEAVAYVGDKSNHWDTVVSENMKVHVHRDTAIVTGTYHEKGTSAGKPFDNHGLFTDTWVLRNGTWRCIAGHDSYPAKE